MFLPTRSRYNTLALHIYRGFPARNGRLTIRVAKSLPRCHDEPRPSHVDPLLPALKSIMYQNAYGPSSRSYGSTSRDTARIEGARRAMSAATSPLPAHWGPPTTTTLPVPSSPRYPTTSTLTCARKVYASRDGAILKVQKTEKGECLQLMLNPGGLIKISIEVDGKEVHRNLYVDGPQKLRSHDVQWIELKRTQDSWSFADGSAEPQSQYMPTRIPASPALTLRSDFGEPTIIKRASLRSEKPGINVGQLVYVTGDVKEHDPDPEKLSKAFTIGPTGAAWSRTTVTIEEKKISYETALPGCDFLLEALPLDYTEASGWRHVTLIPNLTCFKWKTASPRRKSASRSSHHPTLDPTTSTYPDHAQGGTPLNPRKRGGGHSPSIGPSLQPPTIRSTRTPSIPPTVTGSIGATRPGSGLSARTHTGSGPTAMYETETDTHAQPSSDPPPKANKGFFFGRLSRK